MSWAANAERRRAFRIERYIVTREVYVLRGWSGAKSEASAARLEDAGYRIVERRPSYAEPGHYGR
ncbi:MAG: hypothetical protein RLW61_04565 [Gammaproteobacteria bacterium]